MAEQWIAFRPNSGTATQHTLQIKSRSRYTGRIERAGTVRVTSRSNPKVYRDIIVTQNSAGPLYELITGSAEVPSNGGKARFSCRTNVVYFNVQRSSGVQFSATAFKLYINDVLTTPVKVSNNLYKLPTDPGAEEWYTMIVEFTLSPNTGSTDRVSQIHLLIYEESLLIHTETLTVTTLAAK